MTLTQELIAETKDSTLKANSKTNKRNPAPHRNVSRKEARAAARIYDKYITKICIHANVSDSDRAQVSGVNKIKNTEAFDTLIGAMYDVKMKWNIFIVTQHIGKTFTIEDNVFPFDADDIDLGQLKGAVAGAIAKLADLKDTGTPIKYVALPTVGLTNFNITAEQFFKELTM